MIGVFYYLRVMLVMVRRTEPEQETAVLPKWQTPNGCVLIILAVLLVVLGIYPTLLIELITAVLRG